MGERVLESSESREIAKRFLQLSGQVIWKRAKAQTVFKRWN